MKRLCLTEILKAGMCARVRNRGRGDQVASMQGVTAGAFRTGEGGRDRAGKKGTKGKEGR